MSKLKDLTGKIFGRLTVLDRAENDKRGGPRWLCRCLCGKTSVVAGGSLVSGRTRSCGCYQREVASTHDMNDHPAYETWCRMKARCNNKNTPYWINYGGRGISICERWLNSFENFWADMGNTYKERLSIDRIDNDRGYFKDNCHWATFAQQNNNRRKNRNNTSGYRGVSWNKKLNKWRAEVRVNKKSKYLGCFSDKLEAAIARDGYIKKNNLPAQLNFSP